jgi:heme-degrading monooxygenase HmoA
MIYEMARIPVTPGSEAAFEAAVAEARPLFLAAPGCHGMELHRVIETPGEYVLLVRWETVEDHTVRFRGSPAFARWRELAGPHFARPPEVVHTQAV